MRYLDVVIEILVRNVSKAAAAAATIRINRLHRIRTSFRLALMVKQLSSGITLQEGL